MSPRLVLLGGFSADYASALRRALPRHNGWEPRAAPDAIAVVAALAIPPAPVFVGLDAAALGSANLPALCRAVRRAAPPPAAVRIEVLLPALSPAAVRAAYAAGADECRAGPVSAATLALFVLAKAPPPDDFASDAFRFDPATGVARVGGTPLSLTPAELRILRELVSRPGAALSRRELLLATLGDAAGSVQPRAVDSTVSDLRAKLGPAGWRLETAWGRGYRWNAAPRPPLGVRLVRRRGRVAGSGVLALVLALLAVRALRPPQPVPTRVPLSPSLSGSVPLSPSPSDPVARALLDAFGTAGPPAVDVARPKTVEEDDFSAFFTG